MREEGLLSDDPADAEGGGEGAGLDEDADDEEEDGLEDEGPDSPEAQWALARKMHGAASPSMDQLMALVGLRKIKASAVAVFKARMFSCLLLLNCLVLYRLDDCWLRRSLSLFFNSMLFLS